MRTTLEIFEPPSCVQTRSRSKGRAFCEDLNEDEVIGTLKDDLMEVPQMP